MGDFFFRFLWERIRDWRSAIGLVALIPIFVSSVSGSPFLLPSWAWWLMAILAPYVVLFSREWNAEREKRAEVKNDMRLLDVVTRVVGGNQFYATPKLASDALVAIRQEAHLQKIAVWGRKNVEGKDIEFYPLTPIPHSYWDDFGIDYSKFMVTPDHRGETDRVRGQPKTERVQNATTTQIHTQTIKDDIYRDLWFCRFQVDKIWPPPKELSRVQKAWRVLTQ